MRLANKWRTLFIVCLGIFMSTLDGSILNIANPTIASTFAESLDAVQWVVTAYMLVITATLLMFGRAGDRLGVEKVYTWGFAVFTLGSLLCSQAPSLVWLIAFRVLQAFGASMMMATGVGIVSNAFSDHERGKALGLTGSMVGIGNMAGPSLGGILVDQFGWSSIFLVNVPIGLIAIFLAYLYLIPASKGSKPGRFDATGTLLFALTSISLVLTLSPDVDKRLFLLVMGLLILFWQVEKRTDHPMLNLELFKIKPFLYGNIMGLAAYTCQTFIFFLLPFYLQNLLSFSPSLTGLYMTIPPLAMAITAPIAGNLSDRWGSSRLTSVAFFLLMAAYLTFSALTASPDPLHITAGLIIFGIGMGTFGSPNSSSILGSIPRDQVGYTGGFISTVRNFSYSLGIALAVAIFTGILHNQPDSASASAYLSAIHAVYLLGAVISLLGLLLSVATRQVRKKPVEKPGTL